MTPTTTDPNAAFRELAPSDTQDQAPTVSRLAGTVGLFLTTIGVASVIAAEYGRGVLPEGSGYLFAAFGLTAMLIHAFRDADVEVRRVYGLFLVTLLVAAAIVFSLVPGPLKGAAGVEKAAGYHFLPFGATFWLVAMLFLIPFSRHETEEPFATIVRYVLLGIGAAFAVGSVVASLLRPEFMVGTGVVLALVGLGYLMVYLNRVDTSEGLGYRVAVALGVLGAVALTVAVGRSIVPTVLHDGPSVLKTPYQTYDKWKVAARVATILLGLGVAAYAARSKSAHPWVRGVLGVLGLAWAGVFVAASFAAPIHTAPEPYFVPNGILLGGVGAVFLAIAVGICSDNILVVLTRRELTTYFFSPIGYIVLMGMAVASFFGYWAFVETLTPSAMQAGQSVLIPEPILKNNWSLTVGAVFGVVFLVPALTMRSFSEERRTGSLEVLLTAPVNEAPVVLSKFLAALAFFMLAWVPAGLYLIALRIEGGQPFDYRPMLSYYVAMAATGSAFIAVGLFFSSLTSNQVVAAALTFAATFGTLLIGLFGTLYSSLSPALQALAGKFAYFSQWSQALGGQLAVTDLLIYLSVTVFWLFLTVKVLEARKWS